MNRVTLTPAWVLHASAWRDTSLIVELFSARHGRLRAVARGARRGDRKRRQPAQPLRPLLASWSGRGELKTLGALEPDGAALRPRGRRLLAALYLNELLHRLLPLADPHPDLFDDYSAALRELARDQGELEAPLRRFEFALLRELGYGLDFLNEADGAAPISAERRYRFVPGRGFEMKDEGAASAYAGRVLLELAEGRYVGAATRGAARRIARQALEPLLGERGLGARQLFRRLEGARR